MHEMKLQNDPFEKIKYGSKIIEMRLYDEKRRKIKLGDEIEFTNVTNDEKIKVKVVGLYKYKNFEELYNNFDKKFLGYKEDEKADPNDMSIYYKKEEIDKYGVLAIEVQMIRSKKDIEIKNEHGLFKFRVAAVIIKDNKILCEKSKKFSGYLLPGGHVELGEVSDNSILREAKEELGEDFVIDHILCVHQNLYEGNDKTPYSEIVYYYKLTPKNNLDTKNFTIKENDKGIIKTHDYYWINIDEEEALQIRPLNVIKLIRDDINVKNVILISDNLKNK